MDASALIDLGERHYPERIKVFKPIWDHLYDAVDNGDVVSVDYVKTELSKKAADWRDRFLIRTDKMFVISEEIELGYAQVIADIESDSRFLPNAHRDRFMKGADPWVIALSRTMDDSVVVSAETKSLSNYGLGEVCKALNVRHMNLVEYFEENNIGV